MAKHSIVVLHGFGGMGKTALAAEAGRWFYRTGRFAGGAAFVSFEYGGSLNQLCSWVGQAVSGDPDFMLGEGEPVARVAELLREQPALLILDHFESVVGKTPLIPADEVSTILDAVFSWSQTSARILITTRDRTLNDARFSPSKTCAYLPLQGLAKDDALRLAKAVLDDHGIERATIARDALEQLMERLGGHPLSLYLALPRLREHTPADLSARFEELLPRFTEGAAQEGNKSLALSLDLFLRRLGEDTRAALPALALFQGGCMEVELLHITEMDPTLWQAARRELEQAALVTVEPVPGVAIPFLRFHPTLMPYLASQLPAARRAALEERYWRRYDVIANYLVHSDSQPSHQARAIALRELPNLHRALDLAIAAASAPQIEQEQRRAITDAIELASRIAKFLDHFGRWRERDALMAKIGFDTLSHRQVASSAAVTKAEFLMISQQAEVLRQQGQAAKAEQLSRHLLARLEASAAYDAAYDSAMTLARLGRCLAAQGQPKQAIAWHKRALQGFERLSQSEQKAKEMLGKVYGELGNNLATVGHFDKAQQAYESALDICKDGNQQRALGVTLSRVGELALMRGDLVEAGRRYREARNTFRRLGEPPSEAIVWHQLGIVAQKAQNWDEAERCYREAVRIGEQIRDLPELSKSFNQLARIANSAGRLDDAEQWYLRAQDGFEQTGQPHHAAIVSDHLADLYLCQARLGSAADYARRAVAIKEALDLSAEPWTSYHILARIALAQGRADEAAPWRRKAQDSYAAYVGAAHQLPKWAPSFIAAVIAAVGGDQAAIEQVEEDLPQREADGWEDLSQAIRRLLSGQRDFEALRVDLHWVAAYIVRILLSQLPEEAPPAQAMEVAQATEASAFDKAQAPEQASEAVAGIRKQWAPVMQAVVAACRGDAEAARNITFFLDSLSQQEPLRDLGAVLTRILAGERDANALLADLEGADLVIVQDVLSGLGVA
ncbi:MAG: tetratricopeptide repeat protein [Ardenticatenaceae bacterium]